MCGIFGAFSDRGLDQSRCSTALRLLVHRGPDNLTLQMHKECRLALGHARLKIIDLSEAANQPFTSACGRYEIIFNGEIYNFRELRKEISARCEFRTNSDTEVLLNLYRIYGPGMTDKLNGMFSFAVFDRPNNRLFLARDRFGIKPLYYARSSSAFIFSSEIKPILYMLDNAAPDQRMIATYLATSHCDFGPETFFEGVLQLPGGHMMIFDLSTGYENIHRWYCIEDAAHRDVVSSEETTEFVADTIRRSIDRHLVADVEVGLNISGGVDSAILVHFVTQSLESCHAFTQDFCGYSERPWVEELTHGKAVKTHFSELGASDIRAELETTVHYQEQPFGGVAVIGYSSLYANARQRNVTVLLDGNGVDETFLGYKKYHLEYLCELKGSKGFDQAISEYCRFWNETIDTARALIANLVKHTSMIDGTPHPAAIQMGEALVGTYQYTIPQVDSFDCGVRNSAARDLLYTKIPRGLRFNDRMSMMHSCELRVPFLDHEVVELAYSLPVDRLINAYGTKSVLRRALAQWVSPKIAYAPKRSIQTPQNNWMANDWRDLVEDLIGSKSFFERGWVDPTKARIAYDAYLDGNQETSFFIWQWINLELWARAFFDNRIYK
jgi:asparagine synthase (glutamine-hydrolysing)